MGGCSACWICSTLRTGPECSSVAGSAASATRGAHIRQRSARCASRHGPLGPLVCGIIDRLQLISAAVSQSFKASFAPAAFVLYPNFQRRCSPSQGLRQLEPWGTQGAMIRTHRVGPAVLLAAIILHSLLASVACARNVALLIAVGQFSD